VLAFINEQNRLDDWLFDTVKQQLPELLRDPSLQTPSGRPSKAKVVAFLYQHNETVVMDVVRAAVEATGRKIIANIHDAVVINYRLGEETHSEIELLMHEKTGNPYWRLGETQYERYNSRSIDEKDEEKLHRQRMAQQELKARGHETKFAVLS
jgi:hypothetical protein